MMNKRSLLFGVILFFVWLSLQANPERTVVVLVGDSTMADAQASRDQAGWGWALAQMARPRVVVYNMAKGGRSSRSYRSEGFWDKALAFDPDWVILQFGHNDQPGKGAKLESNAETDFRRHLREYIADARSVGASVVLVTPVARRTFHADGSLMDSLEPYAESVKVVADETNTPVLDLHRRSMSEYLANGRDWATLLGPPDRRKDRSHFSKAGSSFVARWVVGMMPDQAPELATLFDASLLPQVSLGEPAPVFMVAPKTNAASSANRQSMDTKTEHDSVSSEVGPQNPSP